MKQNVKVKLLRENATCPSYQSATAAGADLYCALSQPLGIEAGQTVLVPTGVAMEIPEGFVGLVFARSSLATKKGLAPANKVGVIDSDYRGEIMVALHNHSGIEQVVAHGERIAQLVITPFLKVDYMETDELSDTARGEGGFGSTGSK